MWQLVNKQFLLFFGAYIAGIGLIAAGFLPREFSFFLSALVVGALLTLPLKTAVGWYVALIPLSLALPFSSQFDTLTAWRLEGGVLFLRWLFEEKRVILAIIKAANWQALRGWLVLAGLLLGWGAVSLLLAGGDFWAGAKQLALLVNAFMLVPVVATLTKSEQDLKDLFFYLAVAFVSVLLVAFGQMASVFIITLFEFWQWWASEVIPIFSGWVSGLLLSYSNTWFSYWPNGFASLRTFSVFPDSHSFALFAILGLIVPSVFWWLKDKGSRWWVWLGILAIVLSGTRGSWIGVLGPILVMGLAIVWPKVKIKALITKPVLKILIALIIAFPIASVIWAGSIVAELAKIEGLSEAAILSLKRASSIFNFDETSNKGRLEIWQASIASIVERPVTGVGPGNFPSVLDQKLAEARQGSSAHSLYLQIAVETGLIGLIIFLAGAFFVLRHIYQAAVSNAGPLIKAFALAIFIYFVWAFSYSLVDVVWLNDRVLAFTAILLGLIFSSFFTHAPAQRSAAR